MACCDTTTRKTLMKKLILAGMAVAMLAVPASSMASQPANPGGFGADRAWAITNGAGQGHQHGWDTTMPGVSEMGAAASERAGDNGTINNQWKVDHNDLPVESNAGR
jgi:hypothetical protein